MTDRTYNALKQWITIGGTIAALAATWVTMEKQVERLQETKADVRDVEKVLEVLKRVEEGQRRVEQFICQGRPRDLGCQAAQRP